MKKQWLESERQGRGRRYWFRTHAEATAFFLARQKRGAKGFVEGDTVWLASTAMRAYLKQVIVGGIDPFATE